MRAGVSQKKFALLIGPGQDDFRAAVHDSKVRSLFIDAPVPGAARDYAKKYAK